jgi:glutaredoxin 3
MVCVPCIVIPVLLWVFHRYIQPFLLKFWNPWEKKSVEGKNAESDGTADLKMESSVEYKYIQKQITEHPVFVFSKTTCPYCKMAKEALDKTGVDYVVEEIEDRPDCNKLQDVFAKITGGRTVPRVFIGGKCVGGGSETYSLYNKGELVPVLKEAGATFKKSN